MTLRNAKQNVRISSLVKEWVWYSRERIGDSATEIQPPPSPCGDAGLQGRQITRLTFFLPSYLLLVRFFGNRVDYHRQNSSYNLPTVYLAPKHRISSQIVLWIDKNSHFISGASTTTKRTRSVSRTSSEWKLLANWPKISSLHSLGSNPHGYQARTLLGAGRNRMCNTGVANWNY